MRAGPILLPPLLRAATLTTFIHVHCADISNSINRNTHSYTTLPDIYKSFVCQIGTGFTDEVLDKHYQFFKDKIIEKPKPYYRYDDGVEPEVWFDAVQVRRDVTL